MPNSIIYITEEEVFVDIFFGVADVLVLAEMFSLIAVECTSKGGDCCCNIVSDGSIIFRPIKRIVIILLPHL